MSQLETEARGSVAVVRLNRPEKRNALSLELRRLLAAEMERLVGDPEVACAVLTGAGTAFCAGMDTTEFGGDRAHRKRLVELSLAAFRGVLGFPKPLVCAVNGPAIAGGFALALGCDIRLAAESATFGFPELPAGIPPAYAAAATALPPALARELCLTGRILDSGEALRLGVVGEVLADEDLEPRALELAGSIAAIPEFARTETKRRILVEMEQRCGPLFAEEERVLRERLLSGRPRALP